MSSWNYDQMEIREVVETLSDLLDQDDSSDASSI